jgi:hypothetical protein
MLIAGTAAYGSSPCPGVAIAPALRDTGQAMPEESTTPDLVRQLLDAWNRRDVDALISPGGRTSRSGSYTDIDEARAAAERLAEERG